MSLDLAHVNFALILFGLTVVTGLVWLADVALWRPARVAGAAAALATFDAHASSATIGVDERHRLRERLLRPPGWIDLPAGFFPVLLAVFVLRSFLFEPFRIPSGSMIPTLLVGDLILVNKFAYGIRLPIVDRQVIAIGSPERGDVVVFRYPLDPSQNYVKRVVGLPGDTIVYRDKRLTINGQLVSTKPAPDFVDEDAGVSASQRIETLARVDGGREHPILVDPRRVDRFGPIAAFADRDRCVYSDGGTAVTCTVPEGRYFMMGDNRDNSADSRFWGFVPDANLVGKATLIWMNFTHPARVGPIGGFD